MVQTDIIPQKIISLTPSLTEILFGLKCGLRVTVVTDSCDYPPEVKERPNVGCWFDPDLQQLSALEPDLVMGLETAHLQLKPELESKGVPVLLVNPTTVDEAIADMEQIGKILGSHATAQNLLARLRSRLAKIDATVQALDPADRLSACRILDLEDGRLHVAGPQSFQYDIITRAGGRNVTGSIGEAYPKISFARLLEWDPQVIFNCGFDIKNTPGFAGRPEWKSLRAVKSGRVFTFDCGLTCRTGPRIVDMVALLFRTLYGDQLNH
ncbi:MAG: ABC transporter substrate-binding protein [Deltaproteobacteria bacterium]|jgi:iron complex transport system substrate-binding protein|nr:ABC transporter substrate-binding protein [Deltaproteobacteria bacterium]